MRKSAEKSSRSAAVEYVPCVLKLDKRKFVCYVEEYVDHVAPLSLAANAVKIFRKRKQARRAALAMALAYSSASHNVGKSA